MSGGFPSVYVDLILDRKTNDWMNLEYDSGPYKTYKEIVMEEEMKRIDL